MPCGLALPIVCCHLCILEMSSGASKNSLDKKRKLVEWSSLEARRSTKILQKRLSSMEALQRVGRSVTSQLDLDGILTTVVDAAVELTGAEEGSLLLLDEASGELYMRAPRNFQDDFVRKFRLPIHDTLPGQVMRTGKPIAINEIDTAEDQDLLPRTYLDLLSTPGAWPGDRRAGGR